MKALGFFLIGAPGETKKTVKQTVRFAKELDLNYVQFSKCLAKPLTPLWRQMVKETGKDYWQDWILGKEEDRPLPRPWTGLTNTQIDRLAKWAYVSYHSRPVFLLKSTLRVRSFKEFKRKLACGGTIKDNKIELQGDHREKVKEMLLKMNYNQDQIDVY